MQKSPRYEVHTKYGWFSLDEGSYQDYLAGKLWITWPPDKQAAQNTTQTIPANISDKAIALREKFNKEGVLNYVQSFPDYKPPVLPFRDHMRSIGIDEMNLSVRASNGLRRAGIDTLGKLDNTLKAERGLWGIRNIGAKSVKEITRAFIEECYRLLTPYEKAVFCNELLVDK